MPRGNAAVWLHYGASYAQLSAQSAVPAGQQCEGTAPTCTTAAGAPSCLPARGKGCESFAGQSTWSLGTMGRNGQLVTNTLQQATENRTQFKPPPDDYQRRAALRTGAKSNFPSPNYPHEFKTMTQADYGEALMGRPDYQRVKPIRPVASTKLMPVDCNPPVFTTQAQLDFTGRGGACGQEARAQRHAGAPATQRVGYNIITGGNTLNNNVFEQWDGRDYRRHR